jgi:hypothetical protein
MTTKKDNAKGNRRKATARQRRIAACDDEVPRATRERYGLMTEGAGAVAAEIEE